MAKLPKSPVPALDGRTCGDSFNDVVEVDVPYRGYGGASYKLPAITEMFVGLKDDASIGQFSAARSVHKYHRVLNDLRRAIDETEVTFLDLKKYASASNQSAILGMIKNAEKAYDNAYEIAYSTEFRFPTLIEFEGPGGQGGGTGVPGGWSPSGSGSGSWSSGGGSASASGGIKFGAAGGIPDELIQRIRDGVFPQASDAPTDVPSGQRPGFWPVYAEVPPLIERSASTAPDGRHAIYYPDIGWYVFIKGPMLDEQNAHKKAFAAYTRALYKGITLIRCAQEAMTAVASQARNMKKFEMQQVQQGPQLKKPKTIRDRLRLPKSSEYQFDPEPTPSFPEPPEADFGTGTDDISDIEPEPEPEPAATKKKSNMAMIGIAAAAAAVLVLGRKK